MARKIELSGLLRSLNVQSATIFLILLIGADLVFFILHNIHFLIPGINDPLYSLEVDKGYPEMYQYIKWFWITILLIYISRKRKSFRYLSWSLVFAYFLADDSLTIHERFGYFAAENFSFLPPFGLRLNDIGELASSIIAAIILGSIILWAYLKGNLIFRKMSRDLILLILLLSFFGIVVDLSIYAFHFKEKGMAVVGFIEDAGEMVLTSIILWYVFLTSIQNKNADSFIFDYFIKSSDKIS